MPAYMKTTHAHRSPEAFSEGDVAAMECKQLDAHSTGNSLLYSCTFISYTDPRHNIHLDCSGCLAFLSHNSL
jgi:hypothetical protein